MQFISLILNLPWSLLLLLTSVISVPIKVSLRLKPLVLVIWVQSFWYYRWIPSQKGIRAMALGNVILLGPKLLANDLEHELVHIKQHQREPFVHPILNLFQTMRHGYKDNKYEVEAYAKSDSVYVGHKI